MSTKTLSIKRVFAFVIYNKLKNTPPKDFPTTGEIKATIGVIMPAFKEHIDEYLSMSKKAEELAVQVRDKVLEEEPAKVQVEEYNKEWREYSQAHGSEVVSVSLDDEGFKTLKDQFEREGWGKNWVVNLEEFSELASAFEDAGK